MILECYQLTRDRLKCHRLVIRLKGASVDILPVIDQTFDLIYNGTIIKTHMRKPTNKGTMGAISTKLDGVFDDWSLNDVPELVVIIPQKRYELINTSGLNP